MELGGIGIGIGIDKMELTPCLICMKSFVGEHCSGIGSGTNDRILMGDTGDLNGGGDRALTGELCDTSGIQSSSSSICITLGHGSWLTRHIGAKWLACRSLAVRGTVSCDHINVVHGTAEDLTPRPTTFRENGSLKNSLTVTGG